MPAKLGVPHLWIGVIALVIAVGAFFLFPWAFEALSAAECLQVKSNAEELLKCYCHRSLVACHDIGNSDKIVHADRRELEIMRDLIIDSLTYLYRFDPISGGKPLPGLAENTLSPARIKGILIQAQTELLQVLTQHRAVIGLLLDEEAKVPEHSDIVERYLGKAALEKLLARRLVLNH
jgi:hypothetical protein